MIYSMHLHGLPAAGVREGRTVISGCRTPGRTSPQRAAVRRTSGTRQARPCHTFRRNCVYAKQHSLHRAMQIGVLDADRQLVAIRALRQHLVARDLRRAPRLGQQGRLLGHHRPCQRCRSHLHMQRECRAQITVPAQRTAALPLVTRNRRADPDQQRHTLADWKGCAGGNAVEARIEAWGGKNSRNARIVPIRSVRLCHG